MTKGSKCFQRKRKLIGEKRKRLFTQRRRFEESLTHFIGPVVFPNQFYIFKSSAVHDPDDEKRIVLPLLKRRRVDIPKEMTRKVPDKPPKTHC